MVAWFIHVIEKYAGTWIYKKYASQKSLIIALKQAVGKGEYMCISYNYTNISIVTGGVQPSPVSTRNKDEPAMGSLIIRITDFSHEAATWKG